MFCEKCGGQIADGAMFCRHCGGKVGILTAQPAAAVTETKQEPVPVVSAPVSEPAAPGAGMPWGQMATPAAAPKKKSDFAAKIKTTAKTVFEKVKGSKKLQIALVAGLIVIIVLIVVIAATARCGGAEAERTLEKYIEAQRTLDSDTLIELVPDSIFNYKVRGKVEGRQQLSQKEAVESVKDIYGGRRGLFIYANDFARLSENYNLWYERGYADTANLKIIDKYVASPSEVKEFNDFVKEHYDFDLGASRAVLIAYTVTFDVNGETLDMFYGHPIHCICIKSGGEWGIITGEDEHLWKISRGLGQVYGVEWITSWFAEHYN